MTRVNAPVFYTTADDPPEVHPALIAQMHADNVADLWVYFPEESGPVRMRNVPNGRTPHTWFDAIRTKAPTKFP